MTRDADATARLSAEAMLAGDRASAFPFACNSHGRQAVERHRAPLAAAAITVPFASFRTIMS